MDSDMWLSSDDSSNDKIIEQLEDELMIIYTTMYVCTNIKDFFNSNEQEDGGQGVLDHNHRVHDILLHMKVIPQIFKTLTNFMKVIASHVR